ncbi:hypothetical protein [Acetobacter syzygii]|uniref:hypothetical protein n=2 Tax=Acetobacter syzygii TaxID=146476 RepID=UPI002156B3A0|nr:hypothetical protein [Acetobacter syzygii]GBR64585.1 hypothetical protein AA0483_1427 [Acetobacter syzygii NRIC 0483]
MFTVPDDVMFPDIFEESLRLKIPASVFVRSPFRVDLLFKSIVPEFVMNLLNTAPVEVCMTLDCKLMIDPSIVPLTSNDPVLSTLPVIFPPAVIVVGFAALELLTNRPASEPDRMSAPLELTVVAPVYEFVPVKY